MTNIKRAMSETVKGDVLGLFQRAKVFSIDIVTFQIILFTREQQHAIFVLWFFHEYNKGYNFSFEIKQLFNISLF